MDTSSKHLRDLRDAAMARRSHTRAVFWATQCVAISASVQPHTTTKHDYHNDAYALATALYDAGDPDRALAAATSLLPPQCRAGRILAGQAALKCDPPNWDALDAATADAEDRYAFSDDALDEDDEVDAIALVPHEPSRHAALLALRATFHLVHRADPESAARCLVAAAKRDPFAVDAVRAMAEFRLIAPGSLAEMLGSGTEVDLAQSLVQCAAAAVWPSAIPVPFDVDPTTSGSKRAWPAATDARIAHRVADGDANGALELLAAASSVVPSAAADPLRVQFAIDALRMGGNSSSSAIDHLDGGTTCAAHADIAVTRAMQLRALALDLAADPRVVGTPGAAELGLSSSLSGGCRSADAPDDPPHAADTPRTKTQKISTYAGLPSAALATAPVLAHYAAASYHLIRPPAPEAGPHMISDMGATRPVGDDHHHDQATPSASTEDSVRGRWVRVLRALHPAIFMSPTYLPAYRLLSPALAAVISPKTTSWSSSAAPMLVAAAFPLSTAAIHQTAGASAAAEDPDRARTMVAADAREWIAAARAYCGPWDAEMARAEARAAWACGRVAEARVLFAAEVPSLGGGAVDPATSAEMAAVWAVGGEHRDQVREFLDTAMVGLDRLSPMDRASVLCLSVRWTMDAVIDSIPRPQFKSAFASLSSALTALPSAAPDPFRSELFLYLANLYVLRSAAVSSKPGGGGGRAVALLRAASDLVVRARARVPHPRHPVAAALEEAMAEIARREIEAAELGAATDAAALAADEEEVSAIGGEASRKRRRSDVHDDDDDDDGDHHQEPTAATMEVRSPLRHRRRVASAGAAATGSSLSLPPGVVALPVVAAGDDHHGSGAVSSDDGLGGADGGGDSHGLAADFAVRIPHQRHQHQQRPATARAPIPAGSQAPPQRQAQGSTSAGPAAATTAAAARYRAYPPPRSNGSSGTITSVGTGATSTSTTAAVAASARHQHHPQAASRLSNPMLTLSQQAAAAAAAGSDPAVDPHLPSSSPHSHGDGNMTVRPAPGFLLRRRRASPAATITSPFSGSTSAAAARDSSGAIVTAQHNLSAAALGLDDDDSEPDTDPSSSVSSTPVPAAPPHRRGRGGGGPPPPPIVAPSSSDHHHRRHPNPHPVRPPPPPSPSVSSLPDLDPMDF
ncbi:hypothetical protein BC828DRAFT_377014 [Blastocladiella britannica]|nr:hypothetical protein BC828DRAFT_377014 [Blastocladiella britannica]